MNTADYQTRTGPVPAAQTQQQPPTIHETVLQHPPLPSNASFIERIVLPAVFSIVIGVVKNPQHAADLKDYLVALRDAISAAFPDA